MKNLVYKVYKQDEKKKWNNIYDIYSDGTIFIPTSVNWQGAEPSMIREFRLSVTTEMNEHIKQKKTDPESFCFLRGWPPDYGYNMPIISPEEDEEAFSTLCLLLHDTPPFKGYKIECFGKGKPWIPNPEHDPYRIVN